MCNIEKVGAVSSSRMAAAIPRSSFSRLVFGSERLHGLPRSTNCPKLNRQTREFERLATRRKQTTETCSNRQIFHFCPQENSTLLFSVGAQSVVPCDPQASRPRNRHFQETQWQ